MVAVLLMISWALRDESDLDDRAVSNIFVFLITAIPMGFNSGVGAYTRIITSSFFTLTALISVAVAYVVNLFLILVFWNAQPTLHAWIGIGQEASQRVITYGGVFGFPAIALGFMFLGYVWQNDRITKNR